MQSTYVNEDPNESTSKGGIWVDRQSNRLMVQVEISWAAS